VSIRVVTFLKATRVTATAMLMRLFMHAKKNVESWNERKRWKHKNHIFIFTSMPNAIIIQSSCINNTSKKTTPFSKFNSNIFLHILVNQKAQNNYYRVSFYTKTCFNNTFSCWYFSLKSFTIHYHYNILKRCKTHELSNFFSSKKNIIETIFL